MADPATAVCPDGHVSGDPDWCDTCGAPMAGSPTSAGSTPGGAAAPPPPSPSPSSARPVSSATPPSAVAPVACPHCGAMNAADNLFCESCGYDFTTGQAPEAAPPAPSAVPPAPSAVPAAPAAAAAAVTVGVAGGVSGGVAGGGAVGGGVEGVVEQPPTSPPAGSTWIVVVEVDPEWFALKGALSDQPCPPPSTSTVTVSRHVSLIGRSSQSRGIHPEVALDTDSAVSRRHAQLVIDGDQVSVVDLASTNGTYVLGGGESPGDDPHPLTPGVPAVLRDGDRIYLGAWTRLTVRAA